MGGKLPGAGWAESYLEQDGSKFIWSRVDRKLPEAGWTESYLDQNGQKVTWSRMGRKLPGAGWAESYLEQDGQKVTWGRIDKKLPGAGLPLASPSSPQSSASPSQSVALPWLAGATTVGGAGVGLLESFCWLLRHFQLPAWFQQGGCRGGAGH